MDIQACQTVAEQLHALQPGVGAQVEGSEEVIGGEEIGKLRVLAEVQRFQLVIMGIQRHERRVPGEIQGAQRVAADGKPGELCVLADIQACQAVPGAVQKLQLCVPAHIQGGELVIGAVEIGEVREVFDALERLEVYRDGLGAGAVDLGHGVSLGVTEPAVLVLVEVGGDIAAEEVGGEEGSRDGDPALPGGEDHRGSAQGVVARADADGAPLRACAEEVDLGQVAAAVKGAFADHSHAGRNRHALHADNASKGLLLDARHALRNDKGVPGHLEAQRLFGGELRLLRRGKACHQGFWLGLGKGDRILDHRAVREGKALGKGGGKQAGTQRRTQQQRQRLA